MSRCRSSVRSPFSADEPTPSRACLGYRPPAPPRSPGVACWVPKVFASARPSARPHQPRKASIPLARTQILPHFNHSDPLQHRLRIFFKSVQFFGIRIQTLKPSPPNLDTWMPIVVSISLAAAGIGHSIGEFFLSEIFFLPPFIPSPSSVTLTHSSTHPPTRNPLSSVRYTAATAVIIQRCMPSHRAMYTTLHAASAPLYDQNIDRRPAGSLAHLPRPFAPTAHRLRPTEMCIDAPSPGPTHLSAG